MHLDKVYFDTFSRQSLIFKTLSMEAVRTIQNLVVEAEIQNLTIISNIVGFVDLILDLKIVRF